MKFVSNLYNKIIDNKRNRVIFLIVLALLSSASIFTITLKYGHDILFHLSRIKGIKESFGVELFPSIYSNYLNGYGYANPLFYPDIFLYIPAFIHYIGIDIYTSYKIFLFLINLFSIITMYISVKGISKNKYAAVISSIIYAFASYRLVDVFPRAAIGEALAFVFAPLVIYGIYEIINRDYKKFYILVIGMSGMILSHILSTIIISVLLFIFVIINFKKFITEKQRIKYLIISAFITLLITGYFIFPMLEQMMSNDFVFNNGSEISNLANRTVPFYALFLEIILPLNPWIPAGIGTVFIYLTILKLKNKVKDKFINECFIIGIIALFLSSNLFPWKFVEKYFLLIQFPWRLYFITTVLLTISGSILVSKLFEKKSDRIKQMTIIICLSSISLLSITASAVLRGRTNLDGYYLGAGSEYLPLKVDLDYIKNRGNVITSNNNISFTHKTVGNKIVVDFKNDYDNTNIELPLIYYKGYGAKIEDKYLNVKESDNGLVLVEIGSIDEGTITVEYIKTPTIYISRGISIISNTTFFIYVYITNRKESKNEKEKDN